MSNGATVEVCTVGQEGGIGFRPAFGAGAMPYRAVVQAGDGVYRLPFREFKAEFARGGSLQQAVLRYTSTMIFQVAQTAACNRLHETTERLCRWLLSCQDRVGRDELRVTHEFLSQMLGAGRTGVTLAIGALEDAGALVRSRGKVVIVNRTKLEACACECYRLIRDELALYTARA
jgi:CRP-like cAMP-binding protein